MIFDDSDDPFVAQGKGHNQGRSHDLDLVTLYLNDVGRVALLTHERERELIASLRATRAAFVRITIQFPAVQEAILEALEPLLHSRVSKSPAVAAELIGRTELFRTLRRLHRTAGCRRTEVPRSLTRELARVGPPSGEIGRATSELQSLAYLVCRLLLEKKK